MATHGHGWAKRLVLGSTAEHVRHHSDVPLLLVKG
jgi:nucleotide-binding universal stress UspA family protein